MDGVQKDGTHADYWAPQGGEGYYSPYPEAAEPAPCCSLLPEDTGGLHLKRSITGMVVTCLAALMYLGWMAVAITFAVWRKVGCVIPLGVVAFASLAVGIFSMAALELMARYRRPITFTLGILSALLLLVGIALSAEDKDALEGTSFLSLCVIFCQLPLYLQNVTLRGDCCCRWFFCPSYDDLREDVDPYQLAGGWNVPVAVSPYEGQTAQQGWSNGQEQSAQKW